jgi:hypothetical protein
MRNKYLEDKKKADARVDWVIKNKIQWINPTISPAPKDVETGEIESLKKAMEYFTPYTKTVVLQTKYMGSYCTMYLNKDHSKSYFVSRNGFLIKHVEGLHEASKEIHSKLSYLDSIEWIVVEAELMPWRTLGKGLIDEEYGNYGYLHSSHLNYLKSSSVWDKINNLKSKKPWEKEGLKQHEVRQYNSLRDITLEDYQKSIDLYNEQLRIFGKEGNIEFKPFNILKSIFTDGSEYFPEVQQTFLNEQDSLIISVDDYEKAYEFLESKKADNEEGIMVKPYEQHLINIAPCLKVRTNSYLQLIYGVNFDRDFDYYMSKRNINSKLKQSISDYETAIQMIRTPYNEIEKTRGLIYKAIDAENFTKTLDTRL